MGETRRVIDIRSVFLVACVVAVRIGNIVGYVLHLIGENAINECSRAVFRKAFGVGVGNHDTGVGTDGNTVSNTNKTNVARLRIGKNVGCSLLTDKHLVLVVGGNEAHLTRRHILEE